jgi:TorA maturation chaperone TorD
MESQMIDGNEFLLDAKPIRQEPQEHICICLLVEELLDEDNNVRTMKDKCAQEIENPDQAFCDHCERHEHHLSPHQMGQARHLHRKGKQA